MNDENQPVSENEMFYDNEVAPLLAELAKKCEARKMAFLALVGNGKDHYSTKCMIDEQNPAVRLVFYAMKANGNFDAFMIMAEQDAAKYGGDHSLYLRMLENYRKTLRGTKISP